MRSLRRWLSVVLLGAILTPKSALADRSQIAAAGTNDKAIPAEKGSRNAAEESSDNAEDESPHVTGSLSADELGGVTYVGTRLDVPLSKKFSLIPQAEMLHVFASNADERDTFNPYFGGGVGFHPDGSWTLELTGMFGPTTSDVGSIGGVFGVSKDIGADWDNDKPPTVELNVEAAVDHFFWDSGRGPAGSDVTQSYLALEALIRAGAHLQITPKAMGFLYDKRLDEATGDRVDSLTVLARVGSFPPRALLGARLGYEIAWLTPFVEVDEIVYVAGIGDASEILGGAKLKVGKESSILGGAGILDNRVSGPLVASDAAGIVPAGILEVELEF